MIVDGTVSNTETLYYFYDAGGTPVSVKYNNTLYFYVTNHQCDVVAIMNSSGTVVVEYTYDAWGYIRATSGDLANTLGKANALRYRGYAYDTETTLYYLQSRYYNPGTGRFINADALVSTGQGLLGNIMFTYCNNNPVNMEDPSGSSAIAAWLLDAVVDGLISGFVNAMCTLATGGSWQETLHAFGVGFVEGFVVGLVDEFATAAKIINLVVTVFDCIGSGASMGESVLAGLVSLAAGFAFGPTGDRIVDIVCDLTFGLGFSLVSAGVTEGIKRNNSEPELNISDAMSGLMKPLEPSTSSIAPKYGTGGGGRGSGWLMVAFKD